MSVVPSPSMKKKFCFVAHGFFFFFVTPTQPSLFFLFASLSSFYAYQRFSLFSFFFLV
jgi:hypothetical protein